MKKYSVCHPTGEIYQTIMVDDECDVHALFPGKNIVEIQETLVDVNKFFFNGNSIELKPEAPSPFHKFDYLTQSWVDPRSLDELKEFQWSLIKEKRMEVEYGGFTWNNHLFDSDLVSQSKIQGAVQLALISASSSTPYSVEWTLKDNTVIEMSADDILAAGIALATHLLYCHNLSRLLRENIFNATTREEVLSVSWP